LRPNWAQGEEHYTPKGEEFPQIYGSYVIYKSFFLHGSVCLCLAAVLKQKCASMHQILFQFHFFPGVTPGEGREGKGKGMERERGGEGKGKDGEGRGAEFASLPLGGIDAHGA